MTVCKTNTDRANFQSMAIKQSFMVDVNSAINDLMGLREEVEANLLKFGKLGKKALKEWQKARDRLEQHYSNFVDYFGMEYANPDIVQNEINAIKDYMFRFFSRRGNPLLFGAQSNPRTAIAAARLLTKLLNKQERMVKRIEKGDLPRYERSLLPPTIFAMHVDPTGLVYKFILNVRNLLENYKRASSPFRFEYTQVKSNYYQTATNVLNRLDRIPPEYIYEEIPLKTLDGRDVLFLGTIVNSKDGKVYHKVIDPADNLTKYLPEEQLARSEIIEAVIDKYSNELLNDILHGQVRKVVWRDKISPEHKKKIELIFKKVKAKRKVGDEEANKGVPEIHYTTYNGYQYAYVILKNGITGEKFFEPRLSLDGSEEYSAYLLSVKTPDGRFISLLKKQLPKDIPTLSQLIEDPRSPFKNGFYKAREEKTYGYFYDAKTGMLNTNALEKGFNFSNIGELYLKNQPHIDMLHTIATRPAEGTSGISFWQMVSNLRMLYRKVYDDLYNKWELLDKMYSKSAIQLNELKTSGILTPKEIEYLNSIGNKMWFDSDGNVVTPNSSFNVMSDNYSPVIYREGDVVDMLSKALDNINDKLELIDESDPRYKIVKSQEEALKGMLLTYIGAMPNPNSHVIAGQEVHHFQSREPFMDTTKRRKDATVFLDYLDNTYFAIYKQFLVNGLIDTTYRLFKMGSTGFRNEIVDFLFNRTRIALADPMAKSFFGKWDLAYENLAKIANKILGKDKYTAESMERMIMYTRSMISAALLGSTTSLVNRTQTANTFVHYGYNYLAKAHNIITGKDPRWPIEKVNALVDYYGTDELMNLFSDWYAKGGDISWKDAGLVTLPGLPPWAQYPKQPFRDLIRLKKAGKKEFPMFNAVQKLFQINNIESRARRIALKKAKIESLITETDKKKIDKFLELLEREKARLKAQAERENIDSLKEAFLDIVLAGKDKNKRPVLEAKFKKLLKNVSDNRLRRMVSWKMSWMLSPFPKGWFTMLESEREMRRLDVFAALLFAADAGLLGRYSPHRGLFQGKMVKLTYTDENGKEITTEVPDIFISKEAVTIARNSVYHNMFGLSSYHQGEAFSGAGQQIFLYKAYPLNQMVHDYEVVKAFFTGGDKIANIGRLISAIPYIKHADPKDPRIDMEAVRALRFITTRVAATGIVTTISALPVIRKLFYRMPFSQIFGTSLRGAENPVIHYVGRILLNAILLSQIDEDDDGEKRLVGEAWDFIRFFLPVFMNIFIMFVGQATKGIIALTSEE